MSSAGSATSGTSGSARLPRAVREEQILDVAAEEFGSVGYVGASLGRIAERAGVSKALVITYFTSKDDLYAAAVSRGGRHLTARIEEVITSQVYVQHPDAMAQATVAVIFEALQDRPHDWNLINDRTVPAGDGARAALRIRRTIAEQAARGVSNFADIARLADADDRAVLTEVWMSSVSAVVNWWLRHPDRSAQEMAARWERLVAAITGR